MNFLEGKQCDATGCKAAAKFEGFGRRLCWACYGGLMMDGGSGFYRLTGQIPQGTMRRDLTNPRENAGHTGQLALSFQGEDE